MTDYIVYYRVSTRRQGCSGLGLEAQRGAVERFVASRSGRIRASYTEVESGRKNHRPELGKAVIMARENDATLLVAKLDRLSRDVGLISSLRGSGVRFVCADMPEANDLTITVLAATAAHESELMSQRQKAVAAVKRAKGIPMGAHIPAVRKALLEANRRSVERNRRRWEEWVAPIRPVLKELDGMGWTQERIARWLERQGVRTFKGGRWRQSTVCRLLRQL